MPVIDCSRPTVLHQGLTLKKSTVNIEPGEGALFCNQFAGGDKVVGVFKNATNYITLLQTTELYKEIRVLLMLH